MINRDNINKIFTELEKIVNDNDYSDFEVALLFFLRSDKRTLKFIELEKIHKIKELLKNIESLVEDNLKIEFENIIERSI